MMMKWRRLADFTKLNVDPNNHAYQKYTNQRVQHLIRELIRSFSLVKVHVYSFSASFDTLRGVFALVLGLLFEYNE